MMERKYLTKIYEVEAHPRNVTCLDLGETAAVMVTGGLDKSVNLWALGKERCEMTLKNHNEILTCVKFANNDEIVYSADESGIIKRWDLVRESCNLTCIGHMRSVKCIDYHPFGSEYIVSGSNDTTVRLWDIRLNDCIKKYRGHMSNVNSVKFSPDGSWIASGGTEGSVIIWDIRMSKQLIELSEHASPVTCVQFHPEEMLIGAGRNDGSVDLYDLEAAHLVVRNSNTVFAGNTVKSITFSEKGDCLYVGSMAGVSAIGWEPDRDLGHIEATWNTLGDMKIKNKQLLCGAYEQLNAAVYVAALDMILKPTSTPTSSPIVPNHPVRRSFNRGNGRLRVSIGQTKPQSSISTEDGLSSPNLSIEMIAEEEEQLPIRKFETKSRNIDIDDLSQSMSNFYNNESNFLVATKNIQAEKEDFPINNAQPPDYSVRPLKTVSRPTKVAVAPTKKMPTSVSNTELNKIGDAEPSYRRPMSRGTSPVRSTVSKIKRTEARENIKNKNITVQILTKPLRSKSSIDMKLLANTNTTPTQIPKIISYTTDSHDDQDLQVLNYAHEPIYNSLCNRLVALNMLRSPTYRNDVNAILRKAVSIGDNQVIVDLLGAVIEKSANCLNLDICVALLPALHELLQSEYKFHALRACDTLREIVTRFLPIIQQNAAYYGGSTIGVDITREERMSKCNQCRQWLLRIKNLPENNWSQSIGLMQIQNMIVDI